MNRVGGLFDRIWSFENLWEAARRARRGKRYRAAALEFDFNLEHELLRLEQVLAAGSWRPGPFREFRIFEPKERLISAPHYPDRVVHHAVMRIVGPELDRRFVSQSYACRKGMGTHRAILRCAELCCSHPYVLRCDIRKFYPSVDQAILKAKFRRVFREPRLLQVLDAIVDGSNPQDPTPWIFPGDDLFTSAERRRGLPIGSLTSQWFANLTLNDLDHYVVRVLRPAGYVRYMDDFLLFGEDPETLARHRETIRVFLQAERLKLHETKSVVLPTSRGVPFLGWRVFPGFRLLRSENKRRARRRLRRLARDFRRGDSSVQNVRQSVTAWIAHASWGDTWRLRKELIEKTTFRSAIRLATLAQGSPGVRR
ncbi:MAG: RNA-directed DNA polymerase [Planctomycetes bacterium]|nr:RNA-directed DNA polymerase [Planctomycetota bacterium]